MHPTFEVFGITIYAYTIMSILGLAAGVTTWVFVDKRLKKYREDLFYCSLFAIIGGIIGAKINYILTVIPQIIADPKFLLTLVRGGLLFYGGVIGGALGGWIYTKKYKMPFWQFADSAAVGIPIGHAFGRIGCFLAGCCYGAPYEGPFAVTFPSCSQGAPAGIPRHPLQLYECGANIILFIILMIVAKRNKKPGRVLGLYLIGYSIIRILAEIIRDDARALFLGIPVASFISIGLIILGLLMVFGVINKGKPLSAYEVEEKAEEEAPAE